MTKGDIQAALDAYARQLHGTPRGDGDVRHVSDLTGCNRATWARMSGKPMDEHDGNTLRKFLFGFAAEEYAIESLSMLGPIEERVRVKLAFGIASFTGERVKESYRALANEIIGHPDGVTDDAVIEVKSTEFMVDRKNYSRIVPVAENDFPLHYRIQCAAYALALGKKTCWLVVICRATGLTAVLQFNPEVYRSHVLLLGLHVVGIDPLGPEPLPILPQHTLNAKTGQSWLCKYCDYRACSMNRKGT